MTYEDPEKAEADPKEARMATAENFIVIDSRLSKKICEGFRSVKFLHSVRPQTTVVAYVSDD